jgi:chromosomal replication initiation ATPase DnaA
MNMHTPEHLRQHAEHIARQERLIHGKPRFITAPTGKVEYDAEVERLRQSLSEIVAKHRETAKALQVAQETIIDLKAKLEDADATMLLQSELLCDAAGLSQSEPKRHVRAIVADVLKEFPGITWVDMIGDGRSRRLTVPRQICVAAVREERGMSLPIIGRIFGNRDHTTILNSIKKVKAAMVRAGI